MLVTNIVFDILKAHNMTDTGSASYIGEKNATAQTLSSGIDRNNMKEIQSDSLISVSVTPD